MPMSPHRPALAAILVAVVAVLSFAAALPVLAASTPTAQGVAIAQDALRYDGTYQGECWGFVKKVVLETTGRQIGFDYRQGFFDAGAIEVSLNDATAGDIIQIANDNNTSPDADYPGLHTAIVLSANGDGTFRIVDSNSNFDNIVHVRESYSPLSAATRYAGLTFHIYRISASGPVPGPTTTTVPRSSGGNLVAVDVSAVRPGDRLYTNTPGDVLRLRSAPNGTIITILQHRSAVAVVELAGFANGYHWVHVSSPAGEGFVALEFLAKDAGSPLPVAASVPPAPSAGDASAPAAPSGSRSVNPVRPFRSFVPALTSDN
jgi:hypothetical protein